MASSLYFGSAASSSSAFASEKYWNLAQGEFLKSPLIVQINSRCYWAEFPRRIESSSTTCLARKLRRGGTPTRAIAVHGSRNCFRSLRSFHRLFPADCIRPSDFAVVEHRRNQGIVQDSRRISRSCQAVAGDEDNSSIPAADSEKDESIGNGAPPGVHTTRQKVGPQTTSGRPASSYYPPEFEFLKEMERPDLTPLWWSLGGVALLLVSRNLIADEMVRWFYWSQVAAKGSVQGSNMVLTLAAGFLSRLFPAPMFTLAKFADQVWITSTREYAMMVEILPLWEAATSLVLATAVLAIADVAVPDSEKSRLNKVLVPTSALALGVVCGKVHPERLLLLIGILSLATALRWESRSVTSALTAVTPAVFTFLASADSLLFRLPLLLAYLGLAVWQKKQMPAEPLQENGSGKNAVVHLPLLLRVATLIWAAVAGRRWAYKSLLQWMAL